MQVFIDYANDLAIITDTIANTTALLHHLGNADNDVGFYGSVCKTEFINTYFIQLVRFNTNCLK